VTPERIRELREEWPVSPAEMAEALDEIERLQRLLAAAAVEVVEAEASVAAALGITERTYRDCTCAGSCEGRDTLAAGYHCQLDRRER
jgi:hypothetical protein